MVKRTHRVRDTRVTAASRFITADILMFALAAGILMVAEARRHNVRFVWAYIVGAVPIADRGAFPLFLLNLRSVDTILLTVLVVAVLALTAWVDALTDLQRAGRRASGRGRT